jgi:protoporphyrinogen oxidase
MKIAIIGAGFTGLSAGYFLAKKGIDVTIFEKDEVPGGLTASYSAKNWRWPLERYYHHLFTSDHEIKKLGKELGVKINYRRVKTSNLTDNGFFPLDSPLDLLRYPKLNCLDKIRTGLTILVLKLLPFQKSLEKITARTFILKTMGEKSWQFIWQSLFEGKFGLDANKIPAIWFWARIKKRSSRLGYPEGGFAYFITKIIQAIKKQSGQIYLNQKVVSYKKEGAVFRLTYVKNRKLVTEVFNRVVSTIPTVKVKSLGIINLLLRLNKPFLPDNIYWSNIGLNNFSFLSVVEHTNLIPPQNYNGEHLVYVGKYLPVNHQDFLLTKKELLQKFDQDLSKICPDYKEAMINFEVFKSSYAQPIIPLNYSSIIQPIKTNVRGLYQASMEQVYPWDRGTNYAVALGKAVAEEIIKEK